MQLFPQSYLAFYQDPRLLRGARFPVPLIPVELSIIPLGVLLLVRSIVLLQGIHMEWMAELHLNPELCLVHLNAL